MQPAITPEGRRALEDIAQRYGISASAVTTMLAAVVAGRGRMAQFNIPELGGSGQWMRGGMTMVGDMFDNAAKAKVNALCNELAGLADTADIFEATPVPHQSGRSTRDNWWPEQLGVPSSSGGQNDTRYAVFPASHRLALSANGVTRVFDTGEHRVTGVQQQQGGRPGSITFTSQLGTFDVSSLRDVGRTETQAPAKATIPGRGPDAVTPETGGVAPTPSPDSPGSMPEQEPSGPATSSEPSGPATRPTPATPASAAPAAGSPDDILGAIEKLADLHSRGILTDAEFAAKKAELLGRL